MLPQNEVIISCMLFLGARRNANDCFSWKGVLMIVASMMIVAPANLSTGKRFKFKMRVRSL